MKRQLRRRPDEETRLHEGLSTENTAYLKYKEILSLDEDVVLFKGLIVHLVRDNLFIQTIFASTCDGDPVCTV